MTPDKFIATGGEGWADVWKRGHFGWEYKGKRKDLTSAYAQLQQYAVPSYAGLQGEDINRQQDGNGNLCTAS
jgi:hypothetical protein